MYIYIYIYIRCHTGSQHFHFGIAGYCDRPTQSQADCLLELGFEHQASMNKTPRFVQECGHALFIILFSLACVIHICRFFVVQIQMCSHLVSACPRPPGPRHFSAAGRSSTDPLLQCDEAEEGAEESRRSKGNIREILATEPSTLS